MILCRATPEDASELRACVVAAYAPFQDLSLPDVTGSLEDDILAGHVWVVKMGGKVRGGIVLVLGAAAHIANLAVHPDANGQGAGKALIEHARQVATEAGYREINLATHAKMTGTQAFYRKQGWIETGRVGPKFYFQLKLD